MIHYCGVAEARGKMPCEDQCDECRDYETGDYVGYDTKCYELAKSFLSDQWMLSPEDKTSDLKEHITGRLAQRIQNEIESFIEEEFK